MRRIGLILALLAVLLLAGCGGSTHSTTPHIVRLAPGPVVAVCDPPPGQGHAGACTTQTGFALPLLTLTGRFIPDFYEGNGCKTWAPAKGHIAGAIVKAYEFRADGCFSSSWRQLTALGIWHAAYDFLRPGSCTLEAAKYVAIVDSAGGFNSGPPIADAEVPLPAGFVACWVIAAEHDSGSQTAVVYSSPGTWPGGGRPANALLWEANFGATPDCIWTCNRVAWQFTDSTLGPDPHCTIIGCGDISLDTGITNLLAHPKPRPVDLGGAQHYERYPNAPARPDRERVSVEGWDSHGCLNPARRLVCKFTRAHLAFDLARDQTLYDRDSRTVRDSLRLPGRIQGLVRRLTGRGVVKRWL